MGMSYSLLARAESFPYHQTPVGYAQVTLRIRVTTFAHTAMKFNMEAKADY